MPLDSPSLPLSSTEPRDRVLSWEGVFNARDLGGLPVAGGGRTRWGALVRCDILTRLTPAGRRALIDHGVRTIVDLRFPEETAGDGDSYPFRDGSAHDGKPGYVNVPVFVRGTADDEAATKAAYAAATNRALLNRLDLELGMRGIAAVASAVARAPDGGVLVHCHAGKDRTGALVAVLLSLVGVADEAIAHDYALSADTLAPLIQEWLDGITDDPAERARLTQLAHPTSEAMLDTLAYLREQHGGARAYLLAGGLGQDDLALLADRLVEGVAGP